MGKGGSAPAAPPPIAPPTKVVEVKAPKQSDVIGKKKKRKGFSDTVLSDGGLGTTGQAPAGGSAGGSTLLGQAL